MCHKNPLFIQNMKYDKICTHPTSNMADFPTLHVRCFYVIKSGNSDKEKVSKGREVGGRSPESDSFFSLGSVKKYPFS